jgi:hypothetical protein
MSAVIIRPKIKYKYEFHVDTARCIEWNCSEDNHLFFPMFQLRTFWTGFNQISILDIYAKRCKPTYCHV